MAASSEALLRYIRRLVFASQPGEASDATLLGRFISQRDERAFTVLVDRHGPLVMQVCSRVLGNVQDAEDAFQAAFLILARKASTVHPRETLTAWLHGVARRVALKARSARTRQVREAPRGAAPPADPRPDPLDDISGRELLMVIDEELQRLPEAYRLPVILCCLDGRSLEEAARQLGWSRGSVKGRLERGRARLHDRLVRRGLTLSAALAAAELSRGTASATVVARLADSTVRGAMAALGSPKTAALAVSTRAATLATETIRSMALAKLKLAAALLLPTCVLATGLVLYESGQSPTAQVAQVRSPPIAAVDRPAIARNQPAPSRDEDDSQIIEVSGRVFDPQANPFPRARLYVGYSGRHNVRHSSPDTQLQEAAYPLRATSGADGRFHFTFALSELDPKSLDDSKPAVVAVADGLGAGWAEIGASTGGNELNLKLVEDLSLDGRILDQDRRPVPGARVLVRDIMSDSEKGVTRFLRGDSSSWSHRSWIGPLPGQPLSVTTDADGRFRLAGLGRDRVASLAVEGPAVQYTVFQAATRPAAAIPDGAWIKSATFDYVARPSQTIRGVVRDKATGKPLAGVKMSAQETNATTLTDEEGRFQIPGCPRRQQGYVVIAQPQSGQPYFAASARVVDRTDLDPPTVDLDLVGGIPLSGRVIDQATQKPPRAAHVEYYPLFPNAYSSGITNGVLAASSALVHPDGSFSLVVQPGPGVVCAAALPRNSYAVAVIDESELANLGIERRNVGGCLCLQAAVGARGRTIIYENTYNALLLINPDERALFVTLDITLQPARRLNGTVVDPQGKPLTSVNVIGLTALTEEEVLDGASFTVMGLNARGNRTLFFHHRDSGLGKVLTIRGDEIGPLSVQLDPCGSVGGRIVGKDSKPVPEMTLRLIPNLGKADFRTAKSDRDGRFRTALAPGQRYRLQLLGPRRLLSDVTDVQVELGGSKDLGDLLLAD
jgi:RNA polymerase sigma factor (sigma-70 family)